MRDPVMTSDGHTYDRSAIEKWFAENLNPIARIKDTAKVAFETLSRLPQIIEDVEEIARLTKEMNNAKSRRRSSLKLFMYGILGGVIGSAICYSIYMMLQL